MKVSDAAKILEVSGEITQEIVKKAYRKACSKYHPDRNPAGTEMMKAVNAAYAALKNYAGHIEIESEQDQDYGEALNNALNAIIGLDGIEIEVCGAWVWVTGNTKPYKDVLGKNGAGFFFASKKKAWYFRPSDWKSSSRGNWSLDDIRNNHGSQKVRNTRKALATA